ncbi:LysM peptidoglycan-binding domain-containing protein [Allobranchiibius huperziae]|uniref:Lambda repressor-like predicted transcriptional regulator n=1 Tax=Allobranchiibius huperziae TaxID=1874116 RepID=A0A853DDB2_9MICO|nr:LysM peptidoglycan-binding domain-containing protein [Allobranchiibius huperziae]NYJ74878.1 lambda repressor-like predicted transcriptional regulator [Allobranchiibius huperziae]
MLRRTKIITGSSLAAVAAVGVGVPAYASSASTTQSGTAQSTRHHHHKGHRDRLHELGLTRAAIAKDAGTDVAGLKAGRKAGESLVQIAARHHVSRATLLSRLDATADARVTKLINTKLPVRKTGKHPAAHAWAKRHGLGGAYKNVAATLKLSPQTLSADLKKGETLQQIATAQHVSTATLTAVIDKDVNAAIAKAADRVPHSHAGKRTTSSSSATS